MKSTMRSKKRLTCTSSCRTLYEVLKRLIEMDATAKKMVKMLMDMEREIARLKYAAQPVREMLESLGIRSKQFDNFWGEETTRDAMYAEELPFRGMTLVDTCKRILADFPTVPMSKSYIEYLSTMGGYPFETEDSKNSIDVTMRRLAKDGFCEIHRREGSTENWYILTKGQFMEMGRGIRKEFAEAAEKQRRGADMPPSPKTAANSKTR